jgi:hypothetical protein
MEDSDLVYNFKTLRRRYWIKQGLWLPEVTVRFGKIKRSLSGVGKPPFIAHFNGNDKITLTPELAFIYVAAHTALLHEMAHLYIAVGYRNNRRCGHGETFNKEIDRLYALGAFRKLI